MKFVILLFLAILFAVFPFNVKADNWCHNFNTSLKLGDKGLEVEALQNILAEKEGYLIAPSSRKPVAIFGWSTFAAIIKFQEKYRDDVLKTVKSGKGTGFVGLATRKKLNELYGCARADNNSQDTPKNMIDCQKQYGEGYLLGSRDEFYSKCAGQGDIKETGAASQICFKCVKKNLTVISPNGGEKIYPFQNYNVSLRAENVANVNVYACRGEGAGRSCSLLKENLPTTSGGFVWVPDSSLTADDGYRIRIEEPAISWGTKIFDESDNYFIIATSSAACVSEGQKISGSSNTCCSGLAKIADSSGNGLSCSANVAGFACAYCGNGLCGSGENPCNCAQDCKSFTYNLKSGWNFISLPLKISGQKLSGLLSYCSEFAFFYSYDSQGKTKQEAAASPRQVSAFDLSSNQSYMLVPTNPFYCAVQGESFGKTLNDWFTDLRADPSRVVHSDGKGFVLAGFPFVKSMTVDEVNSQLAVSSPASSFAWLRYNTASEQWEFNDPFQNRRDFSVLEPGSGYWAREEVNCQKQFGNGYACGQQSDFTGQCSDKGDFQGIAFYNRYAVCDNAGHQSCFKCSGISFWLNKENGLASIGAIIQNLIAKWLVFFNGLK